MRVFFKKMGIENIRFKPAYNPYTEVSPNAYYLVLPFAETFPLFSLH